MFFADNEILVPGRFEKVIIMDGVHASKELTTQVKKITYTRYDILQKIAITQKILMAEYSDQFE